MRRHYKPLYFYQLRRILEHCCQNAGPSARLRAICCVGKSTVWARSMRRRWYLLRMLFVCAEALTRRHLSAPHRHRFGWLCALSLYSCLAARWPQARPLGRRYDALANGFYWRLPLAIEPMAWQQLSVYPKLLSLCYGLFRAIWGSYGQSFNG